MKEEVFNQYVDRVINLFGITKEEFFLKSRKRDFVDARYLVYYLCSERPMRTSCIQKFMKNNGHDSDHTLIIHGIKVTKEKVKEDRDYQSIVKDIDKAVFI
jgi:chromosomal replication initiation ATPase DnaA